MSLLATRMLEARIQNPALSKWTERPTRAGALEAFIAGNSSPEGVVSPELFARARQIVGRDLKIPVFATDGVTLQTTRPVTIADDENDGQLYTVSYAIVGFGFTTAASVNLSNEHSLQADFNRKLLRGINATIKNLDTAALTHLDTNKNQIWPEYLRYVDPSTTTDTVGIPLANNTRAINDMGAIMEGTDFFSTPYHVIGNSGLKAEIMELSKHSIYNDKDETIQFQDKNFSFTPRLANAALHHATGYIVDSGALGFLTRQEADSILGTNLPDGTTWGTEMLPIINLPFDSYFYYSTGDINAIGGAATAHLTRSAQAHYGFSLEYAFVSAYNDNLAANSNPIMKFNIANS